VEIYLQVILTVKLFYPLVSSCCVRISGVPRGVVCGVQTPPKIPNYSCLQNPWLGGHCPQISILSVLSWICWTSPEQNSWVCHCWTQVTFPLHIVIRYMHQLIWISTHPYQLLFTVHQYKVCKHKTTWIRLIVTLSKIELLWNYRQFCATTAMAIWRIWQVLEH
jgi:hypothetical protein